MHATYRKEDRAGFAVPKRVFIVSDLPNTRFGKTMRRILREILEGEREDLGDTSTVSFPVP